MNSELVPLALTIGGWSDWRRGGGGDNCFCECKNRPSLVLFVILFVSFIILLYFQAHHVQDYTVTARIGKGSFAEVHEARNKTGKRFALKEIDERGSKIEKYVRGEIEIANWKLKHKNIVEIFDCFVDNNKVYIVMEFCLLGDLNDYFVKQTPKMTQRLYFMVDMTEGVSYLHSRNIIHRDLKPENVLLTMRNEQIICKISDFGISKILMSEADTCITYIGSVAYMAPEITGNTEYSSAVDVFSLGALYFAVYNTTVLTNSFGKTSLIAGVYNSKGNIAYLNEELKKENISEDELINLYFKDSPDVGKYIFRMLHKNPLERPKISDVLTYITRVKKKTIQEIYGKPSFYRCKTLNSCFNYTILLM